MSSEDVYCTLVLTDSYLPGAAVLAHSLRDSGTSKKLAVLVTEDSLSPATVSQLKNIYDYVIPVERISNPSLGNLARLDRLDLRHAFTKIALWKQTQFRKIVYVDADIVAVRAVDELFDLPTSFAAAPDIGWPDCFNSGLMLLHPNEGEFRALQAMATAGTSFDGADQGLLNEYYVNKPWHRLSFVYNCTPSASYQYEPAYRHFKNDIKLVHFIGKEKPWTKGRQALHNEPSSVYKELLGRWWAVYDSHYTAIQQHPTQQHDQQTRLIKQFVSGEKHDSGFSWASAGIAPQQPSESTYTPAPAPAPAPQTQHQQESQAPQQGQHHEKRVHFADEPAPPPARPASPPRMQWDATRDAPPQHSVPEASEFPQSHYEMSSSRDLFHAPKEYPEPPKNMWYEVPEEKPKPYIRPRPIFPWESNAAKPTRVFAEEELEPEPVPEPQPEPEPATISPLKEHTPSPPAPVTPTISVSSSDPWTSFSSRNAWDDDASIDRYVQSLKQSQFRGSVQVLHDSRPTSPRVNTGPSPSISARSTPAQPRKAYKISDITAQGDLPSMPVTPAVSYRQQVFWGGDEGNGKNSQLPAARGVPNQSEWVCPKCGFTTSLSELGRVLSERRASAPDVPRPSSFFQSSTPTAIPGAHPSPPVMKSLASTAVPGALPAYVSPTSLLPVKHKTISTIASRTGTGSPSMRQSPPSRTISPAQRSRAHPHGNPLEHQANDPFFVKNPLERLEELRRTSIATAAIEPEKLPMASPTAIPTREMPQSSAPLPQETGLGIRLPGQGQPSAQSQRPAAPEPTSQASALYQGARQAEGEYAQADTTSHAGQPSIAALQASFADPDFGGAPPALVQSGQNQGRRASAGLSEYDLA